MGNLRSVEKALEHVGARAEVTNDHGRARAAAGLVLPGVGAFPRAIQRISELALGELIAERLKEGTPTLGICLGLQLLFESSSELGGAVGLGLVEGTVDPLQSRGVKPPQIGGEQGARGRRGELHEGLPGPRAVYHPPTDAPAPPRRGDAP